MKKLKKLTRLTAIFSLFVALLFSCKTPKPTDFDFQVRNKFGDDTTVAKPIYLSATAPIDSAIGSKMIFDFFRIETDKYPDSIKIFSRVYDSLGRFITNMADPYRKDSSRKYFVGLKEKLGKVYNSRDVDIKEFKVREFGAKDSIPYSIMLNVDYSGSMDPVMNAIFEGTELFINMKFPFDNIGIATFNRTYDLKVPMIKDKDQLISLFRAKRNQGQGLFSAVYESLWNSLLNFESTPKETPRVLVIFTDGDENYSKKELGQIIKKAKEMDVHIFCVAFGYTKDDDMRQLASYTGGKFYKVYSKQEMVSVFRDIYMSLRYYYLISYKPPKFWGWHRVFAYLDVPSRTDSLIAEGDYDTSDMWKDVGDEFVRPILFDFNKADIKPESFPLIDEIVDAMQSRPKLRLEIQGHTDNVGTIEYNQRLSEDRAKSVYEALVRRGVDPVRLRYIGFGKSKPIASNDTEAGRGENRRTQFVVLAK